MTKDTIVTELEQLGFTANEANVYLALIQKGAMTATAIAAATRLARTAVYPTINSLVDQGLVDAGEGYGSKFSAVPAERALSHLMLERDRITRAVIERISSLEEPAEAVPEELIQVIRSPRAVAERFERLQLEAERQIDVFVKAPLFVRPGNPAEEKPLRRGVRCRGLYEKAALDFPSVKPYLATWVSKGEEVRVFDGELPHKLAIFDSQTVLMPLIRPGEQAKTLLIRHPQLAQSLGFAFEFLWQQAKPLVIEDQKPASTASKTSPKSASKTDQASERISYNGRRAQRAKM